MSEYTHNQQKLTVASGGAISDVYENMHGIAWGFYTPATLEATTCVGFKVCDTPTGTFLPLYDEYAALVTIAVTVNAAKAYNMPMSVKNWPYIKIWTQNGSGTDVNQTADRAFTVVGGV